jgi:putative NIF3 family GTP cyclohydrolase 1 type 2
MGLSTEEIMQLALEMAGFDEVPADSAVYHPGEDLRKALIGIDLDAPALALATQLGYDVVISHHPKGGASTLGFPDVLERHVEMMIEHGVPREVAEEAMEERIYDARCHAQIANYDHAPSFARLLNIAYMNIHLPLDEVGRARMASVVEKLSPGSSVKELVDAFYAELGEFHNAQTHIDVRVGEVNNPIGRAVVSHACGTNGGYPVAKAYYEHGIDTVIYIHCSGPDSRRLKAQFEGKGKNLIITGHIASDSLGINPFIAELERRGLEVTRVSGLVPP